MATLVLIHGLQGSADQMECFAPAAAPDMPVYLATLLGHGGRPTDPPYTAEDLAVDLAAQLTAEGITRAHLVGYSFGGYVALMVAHRQSELVASVTTIATKTGYDEAAIKYVTYLISEERMARVSDEDRRRAEQRHAPYDWLDVVRNHRTMFEWLPPHRLTARHLAEIRMPSLVIVGEGDPVLTPGDAIAVATTLPRSRLKVSKEPGHPRDKINVDEINGWIGTFVAEQEAREQALAKVPVAA